MSLATRGTLRVPGASLSYEVRGSGPLLLLIVGGGGGAGDWNAFFRYLTDAYTVVTYDRRGAWRSPLDAPVDAIPLETHGDDAHRLLAALSAEAAYVCGTSAGALIGLELVARHAEQVQLLVAHEPPAHYLVPALPEDDPAQEPPLEIYRREGGLAALRRYAARIGINYEDREPGVDLPQPSREGAANADAFFQYTFPAVRRYRLDFAALAAAPTRIVVAGGRDRRAYPAYRGAVAVAERLGTTVVAFPGDHMAYMTRPRAFAARLREVLGAERGA